MSDTTHTHDTEVSFPSNITVESDPFDSRLTDIKGLDDHVKKLREVFLPGLVNPDAPVRLPSLLIYGPVGAGHSRLARATMAELAAHGFTCVSCSVEDLSPDDAHHQARTEKNIVDVIELLADHAPAILLIDDFDQIVFSNSRYFHEKIEDLRSSNAQIGILCCLPQTQNTLTPYHAPEYFEFADIVLELSTPSSERWAHLVSEALSRHTANTRFTVEAGCESVFAERSLTFDIGTADAIARRALLLAQSNVNTSATVTTADIETAVEQLASERSDSDTTRHQFGGEPDVDSFRPEVPDTEFEDVGGLDEAIDRLSTVVTYPQEYKDLYTDVIAPPSGALLHGPPGTGKTLLAKALANETDREFFAIEGAAIKSKWFGQSERLVRKLFDQARENAPSLLFFDELDALAPKRAMTGHSAVRSIVNTLLAELDGLSTNDGLFVLAATNHRDVIDSALCRPGRLGQSIEIPPPDQQGRAEIFRIHAQNLLLAANVTPAWFATQAPDGVTGADIAVVVERSVRYAIRDTTQESSPVITRPHIREGMGPLIHGEDPSLPEYQ